MSFYRILNPDLTITNYIHIGDLLHIEWGERGYVVAFDGRGPRQSKVWRARWN